MKPIRKELHIQRETNKTSDIHGAQPKRLPSWNKPSSFDTSDIERSSYKHKDIFIKDPLDVSDIEKTAPRIQRLATKRLVNPLCPSYSLPSYAPIVYEKPKFIRDNMDIGDIEGSRPTIPRKLKERDPLRTSDIVGAHAGWKPSHRRVRMEHDPHAIMDVSDIVGEKWENHRLGKTNPLQPSYRVNGMLIEDDPIKSKPRSLPKRRDGPFFPLENRDIEGSYPGWIPPHVMYPPLSERREFRRTNFISDIEGSQADTVKHTIRTNRVTDPLMPEYKNLEGRKMSFSNVGGRVRREDKMERKRQEDIESVRNLP
jgi:hypothetical protein